MLFLVNSTKLTKIKQLMRQGVDVGTCITTKTIGTQYRSGIHCIVDTTIDIIIIQ